jgi:hypothetical protein
MFIDETIASARSWAIPGLSALLILHHDFQIPRLAQIRRLDWSDDAVTVLFCYGICNVSGTVVDATDLRVTLRRDGAVGMQFDAPAHPDERPALLEFLTGEVVRESKRWSEDMGAWCLPGSDLSPERAAILCMAGALVACVTPATVIDVEKELGDRSRIRKISITDDESLFEITPAGFRDVNLYLCTRQSDPRAARSYRKYDIQATPATPSPRYQQWLDRMSHASAHLMLLPMGLIVHLCESVLLADTPETVFQPDPQPARIIDKTAGDSLSALFS